MKGVLKVRHVSILQSNSLVSAIDQYVCQLLAGVSGTYCDTRQQKSAFTLKSPSPVDLKEDPSLTHNAMDKIITLWCRSTLIHQTHLTIDRKGTFR